MHAHLHAAGVAIADLNIAIDHHVLADKPHGAHADGVAKLLELILQLRNAGVGIAVAHGAQACRAFAQHHAGVLATAKADPDDRGLAGEAAFAKGDEAVEVEPLDPLDPVRGEQHPVIRAKQPALVHCDQIDPLTLRRRLIPILDLRRADTDIIVVIGPPQGMHPVWPERNAIRPRRCRSAEGGFQRNRPTLNLSLIRHLHVPARRAGIAAHGPLIFLGGLVILQHGFENEG